jgi:hypothetical protein
VTGDLFEPRGIDGAVAQLESDLTAPAGPSISTMRNHNFAILLYAPRKEYRVRQRIRQMKLRLDDEGWGVLDIALHEAVFHRMRAELEPAELGAAGEELGLDAKLRVNTVTKRRTHSLLRQGREYALGLVTKLAHQVCDRFRALLAALPAEVRTYAII